MARLRKLTGTAGVRIYSSKYYTDSQAVEAYINETGCVPNETTLTIKSLNFHRCSAEELRQFIDTH